MATVLSSTAGASESSIGNNAVANIRSSEEAFGWLCSMLGSGVVPQPPCQTKCPLDARHQLW
jgi:hypothetical protein